MLRLSWKGVLANKLRLGLTAAAIVLGIAFVAGSYVLTDSMKAAFDGLFSEIGEGVDVYVRNTRTFGFDTGRIPDTVVDDIASVDGVELVAPSVEGFARIIAPDGEPLGGGGPPTLGFSWSELPGTPLRIKEGRPPEADGEVVIDAASAEAADLGVGDVVTIVVPSGAEELELVGIAGFGDADNLLGATLAIFEFEAAQRLLDSDGEVSSISIKVEAGREPLAVAGAIRAVLPEGVEAVPAQVVIDDQLAEIEEGIGFFNTFLLAIAGIALFVGTFLIQNTFRITVSQRTRELALLRAVGATGRQVTWMVVLEALIVGIVASAIGILVGVGLAALIQIVFAGLGIEFPEGPLRVAPRTVIVAMVTGLVVTLGSAILPARKAAKIPPIAALRDTAIEATGRSLTRRVAAGSVITAIGGGLIAFGLFATPPNTILIVGLGAAIVFIGVSVLAPLVSRIYAGSVGAFLPRLFGVSGRLARDNAMRRPRRTAATASALTIGVALVSLIATLASSFKTTVGDVFRESYRADLQIQEGGFSDPRQSGLSPAIAEAVASLDEVAVVGRIRIGEYRVAGNDTERFLAGADAGALDLLILEETPSDAALDGDSVFLADSLAGDLQVGVGDRIDLEFPASGVHSFTVGATYENDPFGGDIGLLVDFGRLEELSAFRLDRLVLVGFADGVDPSAAREAVEASVEAFPTANVRNQEELVDDIRNQIDTVINVLSSLLAFSILIALLGITNTLALSIFERRREIGLLRAVGMTRRQVRRMIRWEAVLIATFGAVMGLVVGVILGGAVVAAIGDGLRLTIPWGSLTGYVIAAAVGGVLASLWPARRGAKVDVLEAISFE